MKTKIFMILIFLACPQVCLSADPWSKQDIALEATFQVLHLIDWGQTRQIAKQPDKYYEINPILGEHPSLSKVDAYMALSGLAHIGITHMIPKQYRPWWQGITIMFTGGLVAHNYSIGLGFSW